MDQGIAGEAADTYTCALRLYLICPARRHDVH